MIDNKYFKRALFVLALVLVGSVVFNKLTDRSVYSSDNVRDQLTRFQQVFGLVSRYYVEPPDNEKLITGAINGMLGELDPHTVYIPEKNLQKVTEQFEGSFEGIGIQFIIHEKVLTVVSPIAGGPSEAVGILPGDQIIEIEGKSTYGITESEVQDKLRGPKGSKVTVTIRRPGETEEFQVTITRDEIPIYSVMASFMMNDGKTGYIYLGRFSKTTSEEVEEAITKLESQGMEQLIFDLRGNSGGYLQQAFKVVDKFIPGGYKIVYTKGRTSRMNDELFSTQNGTHELFPLVIMIDHGSASASEIVAGAVQDLDRGLVVGQTSFGKGLVQNQIPLDDGGAVRLTVARYYTPSGRLIQRPYEDGLMDYYKEAYQERDSTFKPDSTKKYLTLAGRTVYGGGGITPDTILTDGNITRFTYNLRRKRVFFEFGSQYAADHRDELGDFDSYMNNFEISDEMLDEFRNILSKHEIKIDEKAFKKDIKYIKLLMKAELARHVWDSEHFYRIRLTGDEEVKQAIELIPRAGEIKTLHDWKSATSKK